MYIIDQSTTHDELVAAIMDDKDLFWAFTEADKDFMKMDVDQVREFVAQWIEAGDECGACA